MIIFQHLVIKRQEKKLVKVIIEIVITFSDKKKKINLKRDFEKQLTIYMFNIYEKIYLAFRD